MVKIGGVVCPRLGNKSEKRRRRVANERLPSPTSQASTRVVVGVLSAVHWRRLGTTPSGTEPFCN